MLAFSLYFTAAKSIHMINVHAMMGKGQKLSVMGQTTTVYEHSQTASKQATESGNMKRASVILFWGGYSVHSAIM